MLLRPGNAGSNTFTDHKDFMPLTWRPRMDETWGCAARWCRCLLALRACHEDW